MPTEKGVSVHLLKACTRERYPEFYLPHQRLQQKTNAEANYVLNDSVDTFSPKAYQVLGRKLEVQSHSAYIAQDPGASWCN
jgi:hypothetical protein